MRVLLPLRPVNSDNSGDDSSSLGDSSSGSDSDSDGSYVSEKSAPAALGRNASRGHQEKPVFFIAGSDEEEEEERLTKSVSLSYIPSILLEDEAGKNANSEPRESRDNRDIRSAGSGDIGVGSGRLSRSASTPQFSHVGLDLDQGSTTQEVGPRPSREDDPSPVAEPEAKKSSGERPPASKLASRPSTTSLVAVAAYPEPAVPTLPAKKQPVAPVHNLRKRKASASRSGNDSDKKPAASQSKRPAVAKKPPPVAHTHSSRPGLATSSSTRNSGCTHPSSSSNPPHTNCKRPSLTMAGGRRVTPAPWRRSRNGSGESDSRDSPTMWNDSRYRYTMVASRRDEAEISVPPISQEEGEPIAALERERDLQFYMALKKKGLEIQEQEGDGNCMFRAVSLQVYGDASMHGDVRRKCMDFMERDREHFSQFLTGESFDQYICRKRQDGVHGNNPELQAISELFNRPVEVFCPENGATPLNIFHTEYKTNDVPIRLSYHDGNHYNAVIDPLVPTAGLGLGLPGLQPGLADKLQLAKAVAESDAAADQAELKRAVQESEDDELQRAIKESSHSVEHMYNNQAMKLSDMDATYFELEQAALERSMQSYSSFEQGQKQKASAGSSRRRRSDRGPTPHQSDLSIDVDGRDQPPASASVASLPVPVDSSSGTSCGAAPPVAAAASSSVASVASIARSPSPQIRDPSEYPSSVQELVMNGFELQKVVRAYELVGDNFDSLLALLISGQ